VFIPRHVFIEIVSYLTDTEQNISGIPCVYDERLW